ncbi:MAG: hypothetical protein SNJ56_05820, partial [Termitinemataceae bacterium]
MKQYSALVRLYLISFFSFSLKPRKIGSKRDIKSFLKIFFFSLIFIGLLADFAFIFITINTSVYKSLVYLGIPYFLFFNSALTITALSLIFGFTSALSSYSLGAQEQLLLSLPISPRIFLAAKMTAIYCMDVFLSIFFMVCSLIVFGLNNASTPLLYIYGIVIAFLLPLPAVAVSYLIQVPLFSVFSFLRNKQFLMILGGIIGLCFAIAFNVYMQSMFTNQDNLQWIAEQVAGPKAPVSVLGNYYPPAVLSMRALQNTGNINGFLSLLTLFVICLIPPLCVTLALGSLYVASLPGFSESFIKKLSQRERRSFFHAAFQKKP